MAAVSELIVREFFELNGFLVRQQRKFIAPARKAQEDDEIDFFVLNPHAKRTETARPFLLRAADLEFVERAIVVVKGWHTETFSAARLNSYPEIFRFTQPKAFEQASRAFSEDGAPLKILVVPSLPQATKAREESIGLLRAGGVDAVIGFWTMLSTLVSETKPNRNYQKSDLLQIIRILKTYDFIKDPQLELFKGDGKKAKR